MMFYAAQQGHRVIEVIATDGALGTPPPAAADGTVPDIVTYRRGEAERAAATIGITEVHWLGYGDSGMLNTETNHAPGSLWSTPVEEAAAKVAAICTDVEADVLVGYDHHGFYGHPDHVRVHQISVAAATACAGRVRLLFETYSSTDAAAMMQDPELIAELHEHAPDIAAAFDNIPAEEMNRGSDGELIGLPSADIRWRIELSDEALAVKRAAMQCHASQTTDIGFMLQLPPRSFRRRFGHEYLTDPSYLQARGQVGPPRSVQGWPL